jgi:hypothetical protein
MHGSGVNMTMTCGDGVGSSPWRRTLFSRGIGLSGYFPTVHVGHEWVTPETRLVTVPFGSSPDWLGDPHFQAWW